MLLIPDRVVGSDQSGRYLLIANKDDIIVEQRKVELGQQDGELRVIKNGIASDDRIVISGLMTVLPGGKNRTGHQNDHRIQPHTMISNF